jgi:hypothetical protein
MVSKLQLKGQPAAKGPETGCSLSETVLSTPAPQPKKRYFLAVLIALFVISYSLFVMLVIEQGNVITSQRWLIRQLLSDSTELSAMKGRAVQKRNAEARAQAEAQSKDKTQSSAQIPSIQVPQEQSSKNSRMPKMRQHPPKPASDSADVRRSLVSI